MLYLLFLYVFVFVIDFFLISNVFLINLLCVMVIFWLFSFLINCLVGIFVWLMWIFWCGVIRNVKLILCSFLILYWFVYFFVNYFGRFVLIVIFCIGFLMVLIFGMFFWIILCNMLLMNLVIFWCFKFFVMLLVLFKIVCLGILFKKVNW